MTENFIFHEYRKGSSSSEHFVFPFHFFLFSGVNEWEKREIIKASGDLRNHPSVLKYILGRKDSRPTLKVFLQDCNEKNRTISKNAREKTFE